MIPLNHYPVQKIIAVYAIGNNQAGMDSDVMVEKELFSVIPECGSNEDWPYMLSLSTVFKRIRHIKAFKVIYEAGYAVGKVPADLAAACLELASWNMSRYKGRRIGLTGNVRGRGRDGEHLELSMPENVRMLLEPYRRKVI